MAATGPETLIFVDVDGVINVGIRDGDSPPVLFNERGCEYAVGHRRRRAEDNDGDIAADGAADDAELVEKTLEVMQRPAGGTGEGASTLRALACASSDPCSDLLLSRLAAILAASRATSEGAPPPRPRPRVVLASNWRRPKHAERVRRLEEQLSRHLREPFAFDSATRQVDEHTAADRLRCIGDYVRSHCHNVQEQDGGHNAGIGNPLELNVLVLDDFFITPLDGWVCNGSRIGSTSDAEAYIRACAPSTAKVSVKVLHPYSEWMSGSGLRIQVGVGLTTQHCSQAAAFLGATGAAAQHHLRSRGGRREGKPLERGIAASGQLPGKGPESLAKLAIRAANLLKGHVQTGLTSSLPIEYIAVVFFLGLVLQMLVYSA